MKILKLPGKNFILIFLIIYVVISLPGIINTPLFDEDEGFFAEASRNMLKSNDFITIEVNGEVRYDKPALSFWLTALSLKIFGINEFAARLPSFLSFILLLWVSFKFVKDNISELSSKYVVVILASILQFQILGRAAVSDNILNLFVAVALLLFLEYTKNQSFKFLFGIFVFAGLGFLTKGPIAFVLVFGVIFIFLIITKQFKQLLRFFNPILMGVCILIPLPWFYLAFKKSGSFLINDFIFKHNLGRFSQTMESHGGSFFYYFLVLILAFIPFSHLIFRSLKVNFKEKNELFFFIWFAISFLLFSISQTKLPHYIAIGYVPLAILMSKHVSLKPNWVFYQVFFILTMFVIGPIIIKFIEIEDFFVSQMLAESFKIFDFNYYSIITLLLIIVIYLYFNSNKDFIFITLLIFGIATNVFIYKFSVLQQLPIREASSWIIKNGLEVNMVDHYNPSLSFYAQKKFLIKSENKKAIFFKKQEINDIKKFKIINKFGPYVLVSEK